MRSKEEIVGIVNEGIEKGEIEAGGTEVIANPTLAGTENALTGLQVGDTKYKIEAGGENFAGNETGLGATATHDATASGRYSVAMGKNALAAGMYSIAIGGNENNSTNLCTYSVTGVAIGNAYSTNHGISIGVWNRASSSQYSVAIGNGANANNYNVAIGSGAKVSAEYSVCLGNTFAGNNALNIPYSVVLSGLAIVQLNKLTSSYTIPTGCNAIILETAGTITTKAPGDIIATGGTGLMIMW